MRRHGRGALMGNSMPQMGNNMRVMRRSYGAFTCSWCCVWVHCDALGLATARLCPATSWMCNACIYIDRYIIVMLYIIRYYYSVILATYRMPNLNCTFRDGLCVSRYMYRSVLATPLCSATPANSCQSDWPAAARHYDHPLSLSVPPRSAGVLSFCVLVARVNIKFRKVWNRLWDGKTVWT